MNLVHLQLFVRIAKTNNISKAGEELGISPAVASTYIGKLEKDIGVRLLHRTTRYVSLSEDGKAFLPFAETILENIEAAKSSIGAGYINPTGTLRITAPASFGRQHLLPAIAEFIKLYPKISIDLNLSDSIIDLADGSYDIAIRNADLKDSSLAARKISSDKRIVCASPDYLNQYGTPNKPEDLLDHSIISLRSLETWQFKRDKDIVRVKLNPKIKTDNGEATRDACCAGAGITICSIWNSYKQLITGELLEILNDYPLAIETAIWAVYPYSRQTPPKVRVFIDFLLNWFGDIPYWEQELKHHKITTKQ